MKNSPPIRVFLVEDSPVALTILKPILASFPEVEGVKVFTCSELQKSFDNGI